MKRIAALALAGLLPVAFQASAQGSSSDAQGCNPHRKSGTTPCQGVQRVRIVLPPSPPPLSAADREERTVSTLPGATSCHASARGGYAVHSDGRISDPGC
jgi:hypothetical protein